VIAIDRYKKSLSCIMAVFTMMSLRMNLLKMDYKGNPLKRYLDALSGFSLDQLILFAGMICLFYYMLKEIQRYRPENKAEFRKDCCCAGLLGFFFAICMIVGNAIEVNGELSALYMGKLQIFKSITVLIGYTCLFSSVIIYLFYKWDHLTLCQNSNDEKIVSKTFGGRYLSFLENHTFLCSFLTIVVLYIPYIVCSYPAILQGDAQDFILQGYNLPSLQSERLVLLNKNVYLNAHHPVAYTMLVHICMIIGKFLFKSWNAGLFLVSLIQFVFAASVISYFVKFLRELRVNIKICFVSLIYYCISPRMVSYMFLFSKDVFYAYMMLFLIVLLAKIMIWKSLFTSNREKCNKNIFLIYLALIFLCGGFIVFFRNEAKYIVGIWFVFLIAHFKEYRKELGIGLALILFLLFSINHIIFPYLKITPGSTKEMLSVPFQQTARYIKEYSDEVTEKEKEVIDRVLNYDTLSERYEADRSDKVKDGWNKYTSKVELKEYFSVWYQMLKKHPLVYAEATLNNYYYYLYPGKRLATNYSYSWSEKCMDSVNKRGNQLNMDVHYPVKLKCLRNCYEALREGIFNLPVLGVFKCVALYIWLLLIFAFYLFRRQKIDILCWGIIPLLASVGIAFLGPCNGYYFRYVYMITVALPAVLLLGLIDKKYRWIKMNNAGTQILNDK
jgi:hypothetical protein